MKNIQTSVRIKKILNNGRSLRPFSMKEREAKSQLGSLLFGAGHRCASLASCLALLATEPKEDTSKRGKAN
ncbi:hypothetical protein [Paraburkholderia sediminicola]|uniref:hypothetical protein n=1 Tax=Paraburkholderia sediminicola TaxID=458836 RepID=UPI0011C3E4C5